MEKLIELLNEHFKEKYKNSKRNLIYFERYDDVNHGFNMNNEDRVYNGFVAEETIFGKRYGFIKWLVENDKIDRAKFGNSETKSSKYSDFELSYSTPREDYTNTLLMELAIQDEPIQFLVKILR